jgi:hypothetical protein
MVRTFAARFIRSTSSSRRASLAGVGVGRAIFHGRGWATRSSPLLGQPARLERIGGPLEAGAGFEPEALHELDHGLLIGRLAP